MKKILFWALAISALTSCQKEPVESEKLAGDAAVNISINVNKMLTRTIEDGHNGMNDEKVAPKIYTVSVLSYDAAGTPLGVVDLTRAQIRAAIFGNYRNEDGSLGGQVTKPATGAVVGLPKGATNVDVVVNRPASKDYTDVTNINNVNYPNNTNGNNEGYQFGDDNFDRTILTTAEYGFGVPLSGAVVNADTPTYKMSFAVTPYYSRMEVYGGINVSEEKEWIDGYKNKWRTMTVEAYVAVAGSRPDATGYDAKGAVIGTIDNGFDVNTVYVPEYYWFRQNSVADPDVRTPDNTYATEAEIIGDPTIFGGWVPQPYYAAASVQVTWLPNRYYAVDVESIFINNIKVRAAERAPYTHPWPGSQALTGWQDWYNAFHSFGWHSAGASAGNSFLCMGNMWDQIATSDKMKDVVIPEINGQSTMKIIDGKAKVINNVSKFYSADRNIGVADAKAASYVIYPQAKSNNTSLTNTELLRKELPHIILKVKVYATAADYAAGKFLAGKEFVNVTLFSDAAEGVGSYITNFRGGYIYRFNMNDLRYAFIGDIPVPGGKPTDGKDPKDPIDPDPEMPGSQLIMNVEVLPWTIQNIFPSI